MCSSSSSSDEHEGSLQSGLGGESPSPQNNSITNFNATTDLWNTPQSYGKAFESQANTFNNTSNFPNFSTTNAQRKVSNESLTKLVEPVDYSNLLQDLLKFDPFNFQNKPEALPDRRYSTIEDGKNPQSCDVVDYFKALDLTNYKRFDENWNPSQLVPPNKLPNLSYSMPLIDRQQIYNNTQTKTNQPALLNNRSDSGYMSPKDCAKNNVNLQQFVSGAFNNDGRSDLWASSQCSSSQSSINSHIQFNIDDERAKQAVNFYFIFN